MGNGDFKILLQALLDDSSLTDIEKKLAKKKINVGLDLDFANSIKESEKQIEELSKRFRTIFNFKTDTEAMSFTKKYLSEANKLISQNEQKIKQAEKDERAEMRKTIAEINKKNRAREKANAQNAKVRTSNANSILTEEIQSLNKIADLRAKIVSNSSNGNTSQVSVLKEELALEQSHYDRLRGESSLYADIISNEERRKALKDASLQSELKVQQAQAKVTDTATLQAEKAETAELEKQATLIAKIKSYQSGTAKGTSLETDYLSAEKSYQSYEKLGVVTDKLKADFAELKVAKNALDTSSDANLITNSEKWNTALATVNNTLKQTKLNMQSIPASANEISTAIAKITNYMAKNTAMDKAAKTQMQGFIATLKSGDVSKEWIAQMNADLATTDARLRSAGKLGLSFFDRMKQGMSKFSMWFGSTALIMKSIQSVKSMWNSVIDLDTALVDLKKTTNATASELEDFYYSSNDTAKQLGQTTEAVISATSAWSRLGYAIDDAKTMAENSSIFASISPEMDIDTATDGLVSMMKAFDIDAEDSLDGIISKVNSVGNSFAVSNDMIVEAMENSSAAMASANNSLEQTIALNTASTEITQNASITSNALRTMSMRIRGYDEETENYSEDLENLSGTIADLTKTASTPGGISLFTDDTKETYKSTYDLLKEISVIYDDLSDKNQASLLEALAGKRSAQSVAALISNFDKAEAAMSTMSNSAGNAMDEMEIIYDSAEYKLNRLKETGVGISQNLFDSDAVKGSIDILNGVLEVVEKISSAIGGFATVGATAGVIAFIKNLD